MKKSTAILAALAASAEPMSTSQIAEAIGEDAKSTGALLNYLAKCSRVENTAGRSQEGIWHITDDGRECLAEESRRPITEGAAPKVGRPPAKPRKVPQPRAARPRVVEAPQPTGPRVGLAVGEDGYLLLIAEGGHVQQAIAPELLARIVAFASKVAA